MNMENDPNLPHRTWADSLRESVLCWLATTSKSGQPNVSPKEIFIGLDTDSLLIADIASPRSVRNLRANPQCAVAFINIWSQLGHQVYGQALLLEPHHPQFASLGAPLLARAEPRFKIRHLIQIRVTSAVPILAPSYRFYPSTRLEDQIADAKRSYGV